MSAQRTVWGDILSATKEHMQGVEWSMNGTISMIYRRWMVLAASVGVCVTLAVLLLFVMKPEFTSSLLMQINTRSEQVTTVEDVVGTLNASDSAIRTEMDVITSRKLAARVITKLGMLKNGNLENVGVIGQIKGAIGALFLPLKNDEEKQLAQDARMSRAVDGLLKNLNVSITPRSYSIVLKYTDKDPEMAARVANTLAQEYLTSQLEDKFEATKRANDWMNERLQQMQKSVQTSELAVEKFREANNLTSAKGVLLSEQQLSELNSQLILARTELAETQAKSGQAQKLASGSGGGIESAAEVLNNELISSLREQETKMRTEMADLASRYGERHPRMITIRNQVSDIQRKINEEIGKIRGSLQNNVAVAQARVNTLQQQLDTLEDKSSLTNDANVQLAELERQSSAEKSLYENFLSRSKELAQMDFAQNDARIISPAEVPLQPSKPNKPLLLMLSIVAGLGIGTGLMFLLEMLDAGFRTTTQVETDLGIPVLGLLGELPVDQNLARYVTNKPTAAFTEGVRAVRTAMQFAHPDKPAKTIVVTSSIPEEGKSLFTLSLAQLSAHGGNRVLLVDGDMRRPSLSKQLGLKPKAGLAEVLIGQVKLKDVIVKIPDLELYVVPSLANSQFSQELLGSQKMKDLLEDWRKTFDMIVIDSPPIMAVSDSITIAGLCDSLLFMVRWGSTPRALAANAIKTLQACHAPITGCVMTRVDLEKQLTYSTGEFGYYYGKYKSYYSE